MYYHVSRPEVFGIIDAMFALTGQPEAIPHAHAKAECPCPKCHPEDGQQVVPGQVMLSSE